MSDSKKKLLTQWQDRINVSKKWRDSVSEDQGWERFIDEYKGTYDVVLGNIQVPPINEVYAYTQASVANLFARNPYLAVNPMTTGSIVGSYILEAALNYYWRVLKLKEELELEIMDTIHVGHAWNKVGTNVKTSGSGDQLKLESENLFSNRVSWRDMVFNVGSRRPPTDCLWIAQRIYRPTEDVKKEYGARAAKLEGSPHPNVDEKYRKNILYKEDINFSALWEIHDYRDRKIYLMSDETASDFLEDPKPWPDYVKEYPFQLLSFNEIPDEPYPMSDIKPWEPQILEKIKIFTQMLNHMKRWNRVAAVQKGKMTSQEKDKWEKGMDGTMVDVLGDPNGMMKLFDFGSLPPDIYLVLDRLDGVIRRMNGQPEWEQGGATRTGTRTLGELDKIQGGANARTARKQDRIETHCENIGRHLIAHMKANFDLPQMVRITGREPVEIIKAFATNGKFDASSQTIQFDKNDIKGEYDVSVQAGSTLPLDKLAREQQLKEILGMAVPLASAPSLPPFIAEVVKELLKDYEIKGLELAFDQQQKAIQAKEGEQAQTAQVEMDKVKAEGAKREAQAKQINVDTIIQGAQALGKATGVLNPDVSLTK